MKRPLQKFECSIAKFLPITILLAVLEKTNILLSKCFLWQKQGLQGSGREQICPLLTGSGPLWTCAQELESPVDTLSAASMTALASSPRPWDKCFPDWGAAAELLWISSCMEPVLITSEQTPRARPSTVLTHLGCPSQHFPLKLHSSRFRTPTSPLQSSSTTSVQRPC